MEEIEKLRASKECLDSSKFSVVDALREKEKKSVITGKMIGLEGTGVGWVSGEAEVGLGGTLSEDEAFSESNG